MTENDTDDGEEPNGRTWKHRERSLAAGIVLWSVMMGFYAANDPTVFESAGWGVAGWNMIGTAAASAAISIVWPSRRSDDA